MIGNLNFLPRTFRQFIQVLVTRAYCFYPSSVAMVVTIVTQV